MTDANLRDMLGAGIRFSAMINRFPERCSRWHLVVSVALGNLVHRRTQWFSFMKTCSLRSFIILALLDGSVAFAQETTPPDQNRKDGKPSFSELMRRQDLAGDQLQFVTRELDAAKAERTRLESHKLSIEDKASKLQKKRDGGGALNDDEATFLARSTYEIDTVNKDITKLDDRIAELKKSSAKIAGETSELGENLASGSKALVSAVTSAVESMKDLYGDEQKAAKALEAITGGKGLTDKDSAKAVKRSVDEYKLTALAAGLDPAMAGAYLDRNINAVKSQWGTERVSNSAVLGQLGLGMSTMAMRGAAGISDPIERERYVNAQTAMSAEVGSSQGFRTMAMFEFMRENKEKYFGGREGLQDDIEKLLESSDFRDFARAKLLVTSTFGGGSAANGEKVLNDPRAMADIMDKISPEGARSVAAWTTATHADEMRRIKGRELRRVNESSAATALSEAGMKQADISKLVMKADTKALVGGVNDNGKTSGGALDRLGLDKRTAKTLRTRWQQVYSATLERTRGNKEAAMKAANNMLMDSELLNGEQRDKLRAASHEQRMSDMSGAFGESVKLGTKSHDFKTLFEIGAVGKSGELTGENLGKLGESTFAALKNGTFQDKNGDFISAKSVDDTRKKFQELMRSGKTKDAYGLLKNVQSNLDQAGHEELVAELKNGKYVTPEVKATIGSPQAVERLPNVL